MTRWPRLTAAVIDLALWPLLPFAVWWARRLEAAILRHGKPLTADQRRLARSVGVAAPQRVRIVFEPSVPLPLPSGLRRLAQRMGWLSPHVAGMALGYGVVVRDDCRSDRRLLAHELTHVAQYERLGGHRGFLKRYLRECVWPGYPHGPLESEAHRAGAAVRVSTQHRENVIPYATNDAH